MGLGRPQKHNRVRHPIPHNPIDFSVDSRGLNRRRLVRDFLTAREAMNKDETYQEVTRSSQDS